MDIKASNQITLFNVDLAGDDIVIGGRNYFTRAKRLNGYILTGEPTLELENDACPNGFYLNSTHGSCSIRFPDVVTSNGLWTLSWEMYATNPGTGFSVDICDSPEQRFATDNYYIWEKYSLTVNVENYTEDTYNFVDFSHYDWSTMFVRNIKLEKGNTPTDWTPAPEDTEVTINDVNTRVTKAETQIESNSEQISLRATKTEMVEALESYKSESQAELSVMSDKVAISVEEKVRQEVKSGDDELRALYNELRMNYDFTSEGQFIGKPGSDTKMKLVNDMMQILVASVAATTVDKTGLTADQANIKTLHMGSYTLAYGNDGHLTLT